MIKQFNSQLNEHLNEWVQNSQSISWSLTGKPFFRVEDDGQIEVNLMLLSESYRTKHFNREPGNYCNNFLEALRPHLLQFLIDYGMTQYDFTFKFLMNGTMHKLYMVKAA